MGRLELQQQTSQVLRWARRESTMAVHRRAYRALQEYTTIYGALALPASELQLAHFLVWLHALPARPHPGRVHRRALQQRHFGVAQHLRVCDQAPPRQPLQLHSHSHVAQVHRQARAEASRQVQGALHRPAASAHVARGLRYDNGGRSA
eukprot:1175440-Prorocentrum_minimum.AAC.1